MRYLAIDLGDKRTGLATADDVTCVVTPVDVITHPIGPGLIAEIRRAIADHEPHVLIIGLPLNMDGTIGERADMARRFGDELSAETGLPVEYHDERLSTEEANEMMSRSGKTRKQKKQLRDALAAAAILRSYLDER